MFSVPFLLAATLLPAQGEAAKLPPQGIKFAQRPRFLSNREIVSTFQKAKVVTTGKKLSQPILFTPRTPFNSIDLFVDCNYPATASCAQNQWIATTDTTFEIHKMTTGTFLVTMSAFGFGDFSFDLTTYSGTMQTSRSTMTLSGGGYMTIPVVDADPGTDHRITIRMKTGAGCSVPGIEVRSLG